MRNFMLTPGECDRDQNAGVKVGTGVLLETRSDVLDWVPMVIDKADTEIAEARAVDDSAAKDIPTLVERERLGDDVVHHHAAVVEEVDDVAAVQPPHGSAV